MCYHRRVHVWFCWDEIQGDFPNEKPRYKKERRTFTLNAIAIVKVWKIRNCKLYMLLTIDFFIALI